VSRNSLISMMQRRRTVLIVTFAIALIALPFILQFVKPTYVGYAHVMMVGKDSMIPSADMGTLTMSAPVVERVAKRFSLGDVDMLRTRIDAKPGLHSNVMPISYRDKNQNLARDVTNALADETANYYKELSGGQYDLMVSFLQSALKQDSDEMRSIDAKLQQAAQRDTFVGSDKALENITARIETLETERGTAYATLVSDEAIASAHSAQPKEIAGIVKHEVLASDPYVQALRTGQANDAAKLEFQRSQFTNMYPGLPSLQDQVQRETASVSSAERTAVSGTPTSSASYAATVLARRSAEAVAAGDRARVAAIDTEIAAAQQHLRDLPLTGATVNLLRAQREGAQAAYAATVLKLNDTKANQAAASSLGAVVVTDHSAAAAPRIPRIAMDIVVAFLLLALTLSVGLAVDVLDPGLRSPEAVEKLYGIPVIGNLGSR
jgi:uncharacterized protein involved in exopolysaccharide biosynthesis